MGGGYTSVHGHGHGNHASDCVLWVVATPSLMAMVTMEVTVLLVVATLLLMTMTTMEVTVFCGL